jgi:hypothetical protein
MFGGGKSGGNMASTQPRIHSLRIQTSAYGQAIPIVYGTQRLPGKLLWNDDFKAIAHTEQTQTGGKGGGGEEVTTTNYTYQTAVMLALCEGPISNLLNVWDTKGKTLLTKITQATTIPGSPYQVTVAHAADFFQDVGVVMLAAYSVPTNDFGGVPGTLSGTQEVPMTKITVGTPTTGQYKVTSGGLYTFAAADTTKSIKIAYTYKTPTSNDDGDPMTRLNLTLFKGDRPQAVWTWLTSKHPAQALAYTGLAFVADSAFDLGSSGSLPNLTYEVIGFKQFGGAILDCNPKDIVSDLLQSNLYGAGWDAAKLGDWTQWSNFCVANGIFLSLVLESQRTFTEIIDEILIATNSAALWSQGKLKILPYGDQTVVGNGVTYVPDTTPRYDLNRDDFQSGEGEAPVLIDGGDWEDRNNVTGVEFVNRDQEYNPDSVEDKDSANIELLGRRTDEPKRLGVITTRAVAAIVNSMLLKRSVYYPNKYSFRLSWKYCLLEPMDLVTITDLEQGLNFTPVRITRIEEDEDGFFQVEAEDFPFGTATATLYPKEDATGLGPDLMADPGAANAPIIYEPPSRVTEMSQNELWFGVSGTNPNWGGAYIWASTDNSTFKMIGAIYGRSRMGAVADSNYPLALDPDTGGTLRVDLAQSLGTLLSGTQADADNYRTLCLVENELISYQNASLVSGNKYDLTYIRRGLFGSSRAVHNIGGRFLRLDGSVFKFVYDPSIIGRTMWFKFTSFNRFGRMTQSLANATAYSYRVQGPTIINGNQSLDYLVHTGTSAASGGDDLSARQFSTTTYAMVAGDELHYDVFIDDASPEIKAAIDFEYGAGHTKFSASGLSDQNSVSCAPGTDLSARAKGQWYHRKFVLTTLAGSTINTWASILDGETAGLYKALYANVRIINGTTVKKDIFVGGAISSPPVWSFGSENYTGVLMYTSHVYPKGYDLGGDALTKTGSTPPSYSDSFTYTSTTTSITWSWTNLVVLRSDGSSFPIPNSSQAITGLTANTTYYFWPFFDEITMTLLWVTGGTRSAGSPAIAFTSKNNIEAQQQSLSPHVPLSAVAMPGATTAAGSGGGSGGGSGSCLTVDMKLLSKLRGVIRAGDAELGEEIAGRTSWTKIVRHELKSQNIFIRVETDIGESIEVAPTHPFTLANGDVRPAELLTVLDVLIWKKGATGIKSIHVVRKTSGQKVVMTCEPEHELWAGEKEPVLLAHNVANPS